MSICIPTSTATSETTERESAKMNAGKVRSSLPARGVLTAVLAVLASLALAVPAASVAAPAPAPAWHLSVISQPTNLVPGSSASVAAPGYYIVATNEGAAPTSGTVTIEDTLPATLKPVRGIGFDAENKLFLCLPSGQKVTCKTTKPVEPGQAIKATVLVDVPAEASGTVSNQVTVSGGEAPEASTTTETTISESPASFDFLPGAAGFSDSIAEPDGSSATQAGSHPYSMSIEAGFPSVVTGPLLNGESHLRDLHIHLPRGMVIDPRATTVRCTEPQLESDKNKEGGGCPPESQVGVVSLSFVAGLQKTFASPLYNMVPPPGKPAEFGFDEGGLGFYFHIMGGVGTGKGYALTASSNDVFAKLMILGIRATLWGDPSAPSHDHQRAKCAEYPKSECTLSVPATTAPFLTMRTSCSAVGDAVASADSWEEPGAFVSASAPPTDLSGNPISVSGCSKLDFTPSISVTPESSSADSPTGLHVDLKVPQTESFKTFATANLKKAVVTLPAGMTVNPAAASGMAGCSEAQIELNGPEKAKCPDASKIGSVEVTTPLLPDVMKGGIYIAQQGNMAGNGSNPFGSLLAIYVTAEAEGALIKLAGHVEANPVTGRLTTTFDENPQLPFEDFKLNFFGGERAALTTPASCGQYGAGASFTSWAQPESLVSPVVQPFTLTSGPGGSACSAPGFAPSFTAGTSTNQAAGYSPFDMTLTRKDGEQRLGSVAFKMPPGLVGMISHVTPCPEAQANTGTCPAASQIGHVKVAAGVGGKPDVLPEPGRQEDPVYLTSPYKGAPFGIAVVVHAEAGPFNLGTVVVRGTINVDPHTAQVSIATDASGPHAMPTILQGIPVDVKTIDIEVSKSQFMVNPTSCEPMSVAGTIGSAEGASAAVSSRFQAAGCRGLAFKPKFHALIHKHHSRKNGEYLHVVVKSGQGQANVKRVHVKLPAHLPSRESTLKQACPEAQFASNPAGCDAGSVVGHATAYTPVLPVPMKGPVYFVSHGGAAYPELVAILHGDGVTVQLNGKTFISKKGITSSTFGSVPDVPISRFDMVLPAGPHSALAGIGNMCKKTMRMPTMLEGQNGAVVRKKTKVMVTGCGKHSAKKASRRRHHSHKHGNRVQHTHPKGHARKHG